MEMTTDGELRNLIDNNETQLLELKQELSASVVEGLPTKLASFANFEGGYLIIGVSDDKKIVGVKDEKRVITLISQAAKRCTPQIKIECETITIESEKCILVKIPVSSFIHSDHKFRFPIRVGNQTDYIKDQTGLILLIKERGLIGKTFSPGLSSESEKIVSTPPNLIKELNRTPIPHDMKEQILKLWKNSRIEVRTTAMRNLEMIALSSNIMGDEDIVRNIDEIVKVATEIEWDGLFRIFSSVLYNGKEDEKETITRWISEIIQIARLDKFPQNLILARTAFSTLQIIGKQHIKDILIYWVTSLDDTRYKDFSPTGQLTNIRHYGLKDDINQALLDILTQSQDDRTIARIIQIQDAIRYS